MSATSAASYSAGRQLAERAINRRAYTVAELLTLLARRHVSQDIAQEIVDDFLESGILNDLRFCEQFTSDKRELDSWGDRRIRRALIQKGIDREAIATVLDPYDPEAELARAVNLLEGRIPNDQSSLRERARLFDFLLRKGYHACEARSAIKIATGDPLEDQN